VNTQQATYQIRPVRESEQAFVLSTFVNGWVKNQVTNLQERRSRWNTVPAVYRCLPMDLICTHYHDAMKAHLSQGKCLVAGDEGDGVLLGYTVYSLAPNVLYWCYIKPDFKGFSIEEDMIRFCRFDPDRPILLPYRNSGLTRLIKSCGYRD
jgi:hypothetical protein